MKRVSVLLVFLTVPAGANLWGQTEAAQAAPKDAASSPSAPVATSASPPAPAVRHGNFS